MRGISKSIVMVAITTAILADTSRTVRADGACGAAAKVQREPGIYDLNGNRLPVPPSKGNFLPDGTPYVPPVKPPPGTIIVNGKLWTPPPPKVRNRGTVTNIVTGDGGGAMWPVGVRYGGPGTLKWYFRGR